MTDWQRPRACSSHSCPEVGVAGPFIVIKSSDLDGPGMLTRPEFADLVEAIKNGEYDHLCSPA